MSVIADTYEHILFPLNIYYRRGSLPTVVPEFHINKCVLITTYEDQPAADFVTETIYESHPNARIYNIMYRSDELATTEVLKEIMKTVNGCKADSIFAVGGGSVIDIAASAVCACSADKRPSFFVSPTNGKPILALAGAYILDGAVVRDSNAVPSSVVIDSGICKPSLRDVQAVLAVAEVGSKSIMNTFFEKVKEITKKLIIENNPTSPYWAESASNVVGVLALAQPTVETLVANYNY